jgi:hypothetical protein
LSVARAILEGRSQNVFYFYFGDVVAINVRKSGVRVDIIANIQVTVFPFLYAIKPQAARIVWNWGGGSRGAAREGGAVESGE